MHMSIEAAIRLHINLIHDPIKFSSCLTNNNIVERARERRALISHTV